MRKKRLFPLLFLAGSSALLAYVGPGAGFAFVGSFFFIFAAFFLALFNFLTFPIRWLIRLGKRARILRHARFRRVIIVGFDGMDHRLFQQFQQEGHKFPNFEKIIDQGTFAPLLSTEPPISPVAWSTFATGVNPGKHNIFDFLTTDRQTYMPKLACSDILPPRRTLRLGRWRIPLSAAKIEWKRKSQSFWKIISQHGVFAAVLRVPFTFPPEKLYGVLLSGLGTPDLRGSQGSFTFFSAQAGQEFDLSGAVHEKLEKIAEREYQGKISGPPHPFKESRPALSLSFRLLLDENGAGAQLRIGREKFRLEKGKLSDWIKMEFRAGIVGVAGIAQFLLQESESLQLYVSPIHIDPAKPAMPVSQPRIFSVYLGKLLGSFATLGMAEDTWALNERVISEKDFLDQVYRTQEEREKIFFDTLNKVKMGLLVQVFETTDRIQHMFWRYLPASGSPADKPGQSDEVTKAINVSYHKMDDFLGRLLPRLKEKDLLLIVSDHGFSAFNRGFHLNSWLRREGYLVLKDGQQASGKWYADVDWSKSRAYGQGLNGIFLNMRDREKYGIVKAGREAEDLKREIHQKLLQVRDQERPKAPIRSVFRREEIYHGPYTENAPDLVIGYEAGYRVSWESAVNYVGHDLFSDNLRLWSGDHAFTREQIPGIFFCNRKIAGKEPALIDIAPTVLSLFGIARPAFIEGRDLQVQ